MSEKLRPLSFEKLMGLKATFSEKERNINLEGREFGGNLLVASAEQMYRLLHPFAVFLR